MLNHITIHGRLTKDPAVRYTQTGAAVCTFSVAVGRDFTSEDGTRKTDFIDCVAWKKSAEFISEHFGKGQEIIVTGRLEMRDWTDKDGGKRRSAEVRVESSYFCGGKKKEPTFEELSDDDGELPF